MKITETINRDCCQQRDLRPVEGTKRIHGHDEFMFCVHCGRYHEAYRVSDAAGGYDTEYRKCAPPWEGQ